MPRDLESRLDAALRVGDKADAKKRPRKQCAKCPWRVGVDPRDIPGGYCEIKHAALKDTVAEPGSTAQINGSLRMMACHEFGVGKERPCIGWLANQIGPGNNIQLRLAAWAGRIERFQTVGEQHSSFEETLS